MFLYIDPFGCFQILCVGYLLPLSLEYRLWGYIMYFYFREYIKISDNSALIVSHLPIRCTCMYY